MRYISTLLYWGIKLCWTYICIYIHACTSHTSLQTLEKQKTNESDDPITTTSTWSPTNCRRWWASTGTGTSLLLNLHNHIRRPPRPWACLPAFLTAPNFWDFNGGFRHVFVPVGCRRKTWYQQNHGYQPQRECTFHFGHGYTKRESKEIEGKIDL